MVVQPFLPVGQAQTGMAAPPLRRLSWEHRHSCLRIFGYCGPSTDRNVCATQEGTPGNWDTGIPVCAAGMDWQLTLVAILIALAAGYVLRQGWRSWRASKNCGGGC